MTAIIARAELEACRSQTLAENRWERASATLDALVRYLDAICAEWATVTEADRIAAARLAADTARRIQSWVAEGSEVQPS